MLPEIVNSYTYKFGSLAKSNDHKMVVRAIYPDTKMNEARQTRDLVDQATKQLQGVYNEIFCRADVGQTFNGFKGLTAVGDG